MNNQILKGTWNVEMPGKLAALEIHSVLMRRCRLLSFGLIFSLESGLGEREICQMRNEDGESLSAGLH